MKNSEFAKMLDEAALNAVPIPQISLSRAITLSDAYDIQNRSMQLRYRRGEKYIGIKLGFTSKAKMEQMGVHDLIWGKLTDKMLINQGGAINLNKFIHPRAEPEICFLVKKKIDKELTSIEEAKEYIAGCAPAIEIIDSRYQSFKFSLEDVIADNCSSASLVIGTWVPIENSIDNLKITLEIDGEVVQEGSSADILGDPWQSVFNATRLAIAAGETIPFGAYIMAGAATPAVYLERNKTIKATVQDMGEVTFPTIEPINY